MTWQRVRGVVAFVLFLFLAAPIEFNLALYFGERQQALVAGVLYFFAVTVAIEAWMRFETHPELAGRFQVFFLKGCLLVPIILFVLDFVPKRFGGNKQALGQWQYQGKAALFAAFLAVITHIVVDSANESLRQLKE